MSGVSPFSDCLPARRAEAGMSPRRASPFLSRRRKKGTKERATLLCASLRYAAGNLRCSVRGCTAELTARLQRSAQTTAASQCTKCVCPTAHARTPCPALLGTRRREPQSGHPHGPLLRCTALGPVSRAHAPRAAQTGPSAAMARMDVRLFGCWLFGSPPLLAAPAAGRLWGEHGHRSAHAS